MEVFAAPPSLPLLPVPSRTALAGSRPRLSVRGSRPRQSPGPVRLPTLAGGLPSVRGDRPRRQVPGPVCWATGHVRLPAMSGQPAPSFSLLPSLSGGRPCLSVRGNRPCQTPSPVSLPALSGASSPVSKAPDPVRGPALSVCQGQPAMSGSRPCQTSSHVRGSRPCLSASRPCQRAGPVCQGQPVLSGPWPFLSNFQPCQGAGPVCQGHPVLSGPWPCQASCPFSPASDPVMGPAMSGATGPVRLLALPGSQTCQKPEGGKLLAPPSGTTTPSMQRGGAPLAGAGWRGRGGPRCMLGVVVFLRGGHDGAAAMLRPTGPRIKRDF
ncbi:uncharacterized protein D806_0078-like [Tachyglossus aculeatus]|uniref:uncharacterized protein D806_0078-like n=1 Tax=Tachyglossus aculeatus TaxID=9261 RepID=UPI0018F707D7|nr:uncharacterized protein D806_0078-like [Tachyglossus aculeatus]